MRKFFFPLLILFLLVFPKIVLGNGGDQRIVEGKYFINLARSPYTPRVGEKNAMLISFAEISTNKLIQEDLLADIRIAKLGGSGDQKRTFLFEQKNIKVQGGVLEFPYTFDDTGLHEIFINFSLTKNPGKIYESPDFLIDVQRALSSDERRKNIGFIYWGILLFVFVIGFSLGYLWRK